MIAREVFAANMPNAVLVEVETYNSGNRPYRDMFQEYHKVPATAIEEIYAHLLENENVILDIGASNVLDFLRQFETYAGIEELFDIFVVPTTKDTKQLKDTIKTLSILNDLGVDMQKVIVVANRANMATLERDFRVIFNAQKDFGFRFGEEYAIREASVLSDLELFDKTLKEIMEDETDYRPKIIETKGTNEQMKWVKLDLAKRAGRRLYENLREVFKTITESEKV
jgi:hypothetical protein